MNTLSKQVALLLALALAVPAGCGSSGGSDAPTKAAFIKQADAICKKADDEQTKALEELANNKGSLEKLSSAEQLDLAVELGLPPIQKEGEKLGELTPPAGDEGQVEAFVETIEEATKKAEADPSLLTSGAGPFEKADKLGKSYGFKACSESS